MSLYEINKDMSHVSLSQFSLVKVKKFFPKGVCFHFLVNQAVPMISYYPMKTMKMDGSVDG